MILKLGTIFRMQIGHFESALSGPTPYVLKYTYLLAAPVHFDRRAFHMVHFIDVLAMVLRGGVVLGELLIQLDVVFQEGGRFI